MDNLTLEHLSAYLPYGLEITFEGDEYIHSMVGVEDTTNGIILISIFNDYGRCDISKVKPLLRPLSQLTQEIVHNGKKFVPWVEINKFLNNGEYQPHFNVIEYNEWDSLTISFGDYCAGYSINLEALPVIKKLFSWHFDVFGLIEKKLAIDINTLK